MAARITSYTFYPSANASARPYLPEELRDNPALYPDAQTKRRLALLENAPSKMQETLDSQWITVRDGR
jgi:putrescine transport system substrate-binding protein